MAQDKDRRSNTGPANKQTQAPATPATPATPAATSQKKLTPYKQVSSAPKPKQRRGIRHDPASR